MARRPRNATERPTKQQILAYIEEAPGRVGKREIARAFHLHGSDRIWLKEILRELESDGLLERKRGRRVSAAGRLPEVTLVRVDHIDEDGEVIAIPASWPEEDAPPPPKIYLTQGGRRRMAPGIGERVLARLRYASDGTYEGSPIRVLGPGERSLLGIFERDDRGAGRLVPADRRHKHPYTVDQEHEGGAEPGEYVVAESIPGGGRHQRARILDRIGSSDNPRSISLVAIHTHGLPVEFPASALEQAKRAAPVALGDREDLRSLPLVTIDGADASDFDDAVFASPDDAPDNSGGWRIVVAIADVAWYVRHGDPLDLAARGRGNSAYFPDRVVPMLPEKLSNDLCSLRPGVDRACLAADMRISREGRLLSHVFRRGLMRSAARLTYEQVQNARDGSPDDKTKSLMALVIEPLFGAYEALARARDKRGTLDLDLPERQVVLNEEGWVDKILPRPRYDSHRLIEEYMIAANVAAAEALQAKQAPVMYRIHEPPALGDVETLRESLSTLGFKLARAGALRPTHFADILNRAAHTDKLQIVSDLILRAQSKAVYGPGDSGHFGLALRRYCHFTSPIRRYADLLVHRTLIREFGLGEGALPTEADDAFTAIGEQISSTERRAVAAEREALDRFTSAFLADRIGSIFSGRISGVTRFGLFIRLEETGADGFVPVRTLPWDRYHYDETHHCLEGENSGLRFSLGQTVTAELLEAEPRTGSLVFQLADIDDITNDRARKSRQRRTPKRHGRRRR